MFIDAMGDSAAASAPAPAKKITKKRKERLDLPNDGSYEEMCAVVAESVASTGLEQSGPAQALAKLKQERRQAQKESQQKSKELKAYARKVARLQKRASKLSDDGLLVEYACRQAAKACKAKA